MVKQVTVWVCPTPDCPEYYASPAAGDLTQKPNYQSDMLHTAKSEPLKPLVVSYRSECPTCRVNGLKVDRVPVTIGVPLPDPAAAT